MQDPIPLKKDPPRELDAIDLGFQKSAAQIASTMADEELLKPGQMLPHNVLQERYQKELEEEFTLFRKRLKNGASKIVDTIQELSTKEPNILSQDVVDAFYSISELSDVIDKDEAAFAEQTAQGITLQELAHISDDTIDKLYQAAKNLYEKTLYEDAGDAFLFLTNINPKKYAFWLGLANCLYCLERYQEALGPYANAGDTNPGDPNSYLLSSRCYAELGEFDNGIRALELALQAIEGNEEFRDWKISLQEEKARLVSRKQH